ncbi:hypothetical protein GCM10020229_26390 [Kitasatospora albolonga]
MLDWVTRESSIGLSRVRPMPRTTQKAITRQGFLVEYPVSARITCSSGGPPGAARFVCWCRGFPVCSQLISREGPRASWRRTIRDGASAPRGGAHPGPWSWSGGPVIGRGDHARRSGALTE